jgi:hypothetical protein
MSLFYELYTTPRWRKACRKTCRNLPAHGWSPSTEGAVIVCILSPRSKNDGISEVGRCRQWLTGRNSFATSLTDPCLSDILVIRQLAGMACNWIG